jgi:hypothetical protein
MRQRARAPVASTLRSEDSRLLKTNIRTKNLLNFLSQSKFLWVLGDIFISLGIFFCKLIETHTVTQLITLSHG